MPPDEAQRGGKVGVFREHMHEDRPCFCMLHVCLCTSVCWCTMHRIAICLCTCACRVCVQKGIQTSNAQVEYQTSPSLARRARSQLISDQTRRPDQIMRITIVRNALQLMAVARKTSKSHPIPSHPPTGPPQLYFLAHSLGCQYLWYKRIA